MTATVFPKTSSGARKFLSGGIRFCGWAWIVFAALNLADLAWRGRDMASVVAAAVLLLSCGIAYAFALRPRIVADDDGVRFHNLLRDLRLPWGAIDRFEGGDAVYAYVGENRFRAFVLQTSPRARAKSELKMRREEKKVPEAVAEYMRGRTQTDFTVEQLRELSAAHKKKDEGVSGEVTSGWAWPAIVAVAVPAVLSAVTIVIAAI